MRDLVHFFTDVQGRWRIANTPNIAQEVIFSENFLLNRLPVEVPAGAITSNPAGFPIDAVITIAPDLGQTRTYQIVDIRPYEDAQGDVPEPSIFVYYCTRMT